MSNSKDDLTQHEELALLEIQEEGENDERAFACLHR